MRGGSLTNNFFKPQTNKQTETDFDFSRQPSVFDGFAFFCQTHVGNRQNGQNCNSRADRCDNRWRISLEKQTNACLWPQKLTRRCIKATQLGENRQNFIANNFKNGPAKPTKLATFTRAFAFAFDNFGFILFSFRKSVLTAYLLRVCVITTTGWMGDGTKQQHRVWNALQYCSTHESNVGGLSVFTRFVRYASMRHTVVLRAPSSCVTRGYGVMCVWKQMPTELNNKCFSTERTTWPLTLARTYGRNMWSSCVGNIRCDTCIKQPVYVNNQHRETEIGWMFLD